MHRRIIVAHDVSAAKAAGRQSLSIAAGDLITPAARDLARDLDLFLQTEAAETSERCASPASGASTGPEQGRSAEAAPEDAIPDIREQDLFALIPVKNPKDPALLAQLRKASPARICLDRAGPRYKTLSLLRFSADHAAAVDAAFTDVSPAFLERMKLPVFQSLCRSRDEYLRRPDLGRTVAPESLEQIRALAGPSPKVLIYFSDGLSSTALETNGPDTWQAILSGLKRHGIPACPPFFLRWSRVPAQDCISEATGAEVSCTLIGERPGLLTAESLSVYFCYRAHCNMPESRRTVISNIHRTGTPAVEAGAYIADIIKRMLETKTSGTELPL